MNFLPVLLVTLLGTNLSSTTRADGPTVGSIQAEASLTAEAQTLTDNAVATNPAQAFDAAADCAAQPHGLTPGVLPGNDSNDAVPQIPATESPEYIPAEMIADLFLQAARPILHEQADLMIQALNSVCISKKDHTVHAALYFKHPFSLQLKPKDAPLAKMETYRADFPTVLKLSVSKAKNFVTIDFQGRGSSALQMMARVPMMSDRIYLHRMVLNTDTQWMQIFAGAMHDKIGVVAWSHFQPGGPIIAHLSISQTLRRIFRPVPPIYVDGGSTATGAPRAP